MKNARNIRQNASPLRLYYHNALTCNHKCQMLNYAIDAKSDAKTQEGDTTKFEFFHVLSRFSESYLYPQIKTREERKERDRYNIHTINNISLSETKSYQLIEREESGILFVGCQSMSPDYRRVLDASLDANLDVNLDANLELVATAFFSTISSPN